MGRSPSLYGYKQAKTNATEMVSYSNHHNYGNILNMVSKSGNYTRPISRGIKASPRQCIFCLADKSNDEFGIINRTWPAPSWPWTPELWRECQCMLLWCFSPSPWYNLAQSCDFKHKVQFFTVPSLILLDDSVSTYAVSDVYYNSSDDLELDKCFEEESTSAFILNHITCIVRGVT